MSKHHKVTKYDPSKVFFTSDLHFGHQNLLTKHFTKRHEVFGYDVDAMNAGLIKNWNSVVSPDCDVFHLGDIGFMQYTKLLNQVIQLNGRLHLLFGNHDERLDFPNVVEFDKTLDIDVGNQYITMSHYPHYTWNGCHRGSWMLCGHEHGNITRDTHMQKWKIMDVGVDCHQQYRPFSFDEIKAIMDKREIRSHH